MEAMPLKHDEFLIGGQETLLSRQYGVYAHEVVNRRP